jgi:LysR family glycine cleavage system transcriptional activator
MSRLPLQTLPTFRVVARTQNLRAAAETLHLTHSAVSQQIKLLEEQIGLPLFDRHGRRLALNAAGAAMQMAVEAALDRLAEGLRAARAAAAGTTQQVRLTVLPSFAQRWLLPRMGRWRERHPDITLEVHASQQVVDLQREGFHAALRVGLGPWRGLVAERLIDSPLVAVAAPQRAARLAGASAEAIAAEPLLGDAESWERWLALAGARLTARPVADFNDAGLMLQATEQDLGIALARELPAADALQAGRLVRLSPLALDDRASATYWFVHPPELAEWPPLAALREWLHDEMALSREGLARLNAASAASLLAGTSPAGRKGSRSRVR